MALAAACSKSENAAEPGPDGGAPEVGPSADVGTGLATPSGGGVITSAGVLLAAVFAVLGVLPLITLTQIGIIVCIGVLLDTLLVRTVLVPALAFVLGDRFWWPGRIEREPAGDSPTEREPVTAGT